MKNSKATSISIVSIIRALVALTIFFSPNIVRATNMEVPAVSYGPVCEVAWGYDDYVKLSGEKSIEVINDLESWFSRRDEELCKSEYIPFRALGECLKENDDSVIPTSKEVAVGFTRFIVNQCHDVIDTWFSKG